VDWGKSGCLGSLAAPSLRMSGVKEGDLPFDGGGKSTNTIKGSILSKTPFSAEGERRIKARRGYTQSEWSVGKKREDCKANTKVFTYLCTGASMNRGGVIGMDSRRLKKKIPWRGGRASRRGDIWGDWDKCLTQRSK